MRLIGSQRVKNIRVPLFLINKPNHIPIEDSPGDNILLNVIFGRGLRGNS